MKKTLTIILVLACTFSAGAQKKVLDHSVYDSWQTVPSLTVSDDGNIVTYRITPQQGDAELVIRDLESGKELHIERGENPTVTRDGRWAVFKIKAPYAATREAKIKKRKGDKMPKDSIGYVNLETFELVKCKDADDFSAPVEGEFSIAYRTGKKDAKSLVVIRPGHGADTLKNVGNYEMDRFGKRLAVVFKKNKKDSLSSNRVTLYDLATMSGTILSEGKEFYGKPKFNDGGDKMAFLASADSNSTGSRHCGLFLYEEITTGRGRKAVTRPVYGEIIPQDCSEGIPQGWGLTEKSSPVFSSRSSRIFVGLSEYIPPKDTSLVDFETAELDIWNYDVYLTPPMFKAKGSRMAESSCKAVIDLREADRHIVPLTSSLTERIQYIDGGESDMALATERAPYMISSTWDENSFTDVSVVNLKDGSRKVLFTRLDGSPTVSPAGKYLIWYDHSDLNFHTYRMSDGKMANLTAGLDGMFHDDEDDHPMPSPAFSFPQWTENDAAVLITEKYDIFKVSPDGGKAVNLTDGQGRRDDTAYRIVKLTRSDVSPALREVGVTQPIGAKETIYLSAYDRQGKRNGYATVNVAAQGLRSSFVYPNSFAGTAKAFNAETIVYRKGDFNHPMDAYFTKDGWQTENKLTAINSQQAEYNWGNARLVHWTAYDGTGLDGILITPEDLDPDGKYPMIAYFYEKNSQNLYSYYSPAPSRSVINFPFYASRGYVVFIPDIVYVSGHPGESAYNCICSGVEEMCRQFSFIDGSKVGIQGQSWGGYQTAYLVTRTHMFAAAGAGAPVGNMTSAYGGIRWGSGAVRAMQYEHGQSRIGKSLWDEGGLELYIENSPVFHTEDVTTPVLIMHNDGDGAVPWYQGIEFFMALRRFGHPAWLLEYNGEEHNLAQRKNSKDLSIRLQQFFDHYLKGEPEPVWMKTGIPYSRKGQYFGFENAQ